MSVAECVHLLDRVLSCGQRLFLCLSLRSSLSLRQCWSRCPTLRLAIIASLSADSVSVCLCASISGRARVRARVFVKISVMVAVVCVWLSSCETERPWVSNTMFLCLDPLGMTCMEVGRPKGYSGPESAGGVSLPGQAPNLK